MRRKKTAANGPPPAGSADIALFLEALGQKKAENVVALDLRGISSVADYFVLASCRSTRQAEAVAEAAGDFLAGRGIKPLGVEGLPEASWVLLDYEYVVIHVFHEPARGHYDLEGLWADAPRIRPEAAAKAEEPAAPKGEVPEAAP